MNDVQTIGLTYDLVGILILGVPLFWVRAKIILNRAATTWDYNGSEAKRMLGERADVFLGTVVLAFGFVLQIVAVQWYPTVPSALGWALMAGLPVLVAAYLCVRKLLVTRGLAVVEMLFEEEKSGRRSLE